MKKSIVIILLLIFSQLNAQEKNFIDQNYIEVIGKVEQQIEPDEIYLQINLDEDDFKKGIRIEDKEIRMVNLLKSLGIETDKNLRVQNFTGGFRHYLLKKNTVIKQKKYELLILDSNKLGSVFEILDDLEISNVSISRVAYSKIEELRFILKAKAIKAAKKKAKSYAKAVDQEIGRALFIHELQNTNYNRNFLANNFLEEVVITSYNGKREFPKLSFQKITISASVEVKFELK